MKLTGLLLLLPLSMLVPAQAQTESEGLRELLEEQRALIREQRELLEAQQRQIDGLVRRLEEMEKAVTGAGPRAAEGAVSPARAADEGVDQRDKAERAIRDSVGDLNQQGVRAGEFPGSILIPGTGNVSLAVGGFVKAVVIGDSNAEAQGADFLPATLGASRPDQAGATSLDATLTRLNVDGRAPLPSGKLRGYFEWDVNRGNNGTPDFKVRHAYGLWENARGALVAGHTWSTTMDLKIIPEGLTEPTVSGVMFTRQAQLRWSQPLGSDVTFHAAIENPDSSDVFSEAPNPNTTHLPDMALGFDHDSGGGWHLRLNGLLRELRVNLPNGTTDAETGWGLALTGHVDLLEADKLVYSGVYGEGLGRYLLGIQPTSGAAIVPAGDRLTLRKNWGGMLAYKRRWAKGVRSHAMFGYAKSDPLAFQAAETFESSTYGAVNLLWTIQPYLTLGAEYGYGKRENRDGSSLDNHRVMFGVQIF